MLRSLVAAHDEFDWSTMNKRQVTKSKYFKALFKHKTLITIIYACYEPFNTHINILWAQFLYNFYFICPYHKITQNIKHLCCVPIFFSLLYNMPFKSISFIGTRTLKLCFTWLIFSISQYTKCCRIRIVVSFYFYYYNYVLCYSWHDTMQHWVCIHLSHHLCLIKGVITRTFTLNHYFYVFLWYFFYTIRSETR